MINTYTYSRILIAFIFLGIFISSCSKEEYNLDDNITIPNPADTIVIDDRVVLNVGGIETQLGGIYSECFASQGSQLPEYTHVLAYAENFVIEDSQAFYDGPLNLLFWTSSDKLTEGRYLVEGIYYDPLTQEEENSLYDLNITEVTDFFIEGEFEKLGNSAAASSGEFKTSFYSCDEIGLDEEDLVEYADGRMTLSINSGEEQLLMSVIAYCDDAFVDKPGTAKLLFGGGAFYFDDNNEINFDEDPEILIIFDMDLGEVELGQSFKAYYLGDIQALLNSPDDPLYSDFIAMSSEISVTITSETENYLIGTYVGQLQDGTKVEGQFRANITRAC